MSTCLDVPSPTVGENPDSLSDSSLPTEHIYGRALHNETYAGTRLNISEESIRRILRAGVYVPTLAFFHDTEELDQAAIAKHATRMAKAGVTGLVTHDTYGEAAHLSHKERTIVTRTSRHAVASAGYPQLPIIVGCGAPSTSETIELCHDAQTSGGDYALIHPPSTYKRHYNAHTIKEFFTDVAGASPIPILIDNEPHVTAGTDLDSDTIVELSRHANIVGCKLACMDAGKFNRIAGALKPATATDRGSGFVCFGGSADITLQSLVGGGSGVVAGLANLTPKTCVRLVELYHLGKPDEARRLQGAVSRADGVAARHGVVGVKSALRSFFGYGGFARKPLPRPSEKDVAEHSTGFHEICDFENAL